MRWFGRDEFEEYIYTPETYGEETENVTKRIPWIYFPIIGGVILLIIFFVYAIGSAHPSAVIINGTTISGNVECRLDNGPDLNCTPGAVFPVMATSICQPSYPRLTIDDTTRLDIYRRYGITNIDGWDIQYYIPLELGGMNTTANIYPMAQYPKPGYEERTKAAQELLRQVCSNDIQLTVAQYIMTHDWQSKKELWGG